MRLWFALAGMALLAAFGCQSATQKFSEAPATVAAARTDDDDLIVSAVAEAFFVASDWNAPDWSEGDFVVFRPEWASDRRPDFEAELISAILYEDGYKEGKRKAEFLRKLEEKVAKSATGFAPPRLRKLAELDIGSRAVLSNVKRAILRSMDQEKVRNRAGKEGTVRTMGSLEPPGYSKDGRYACVHMGGVPWSIHSADLDFFFERSEKGWKLIHVKAIFYV